MLLDVIKDEFDRKGGAELNSVQALLLYNIGESELTAGELKTRGYYLGSNVSYNLKKLVDMGYIHYKRSDTDRRSVRVSLTQKGLEARDIVSKLYHRQLGSVQAVGEVTSEDIKGLNKSLVAPRALLVGPDPLSPVSAPSPTGRVRARVGTRGARKTKAAVLRTGRGGLFSLSCRGFAGSRLWPLDRGPKELRYQAPSATRADAREALGFASRARIGPRPPLWRVRVRLAMLRVPW